MGFSCSWQASNECTSSHNALVLLFFTPATAATIAIADFLAPDEHRVCFRGAIPHPESK
jgi:hypothetical protein